MSMMWNAISVSLLISSVQFYPCRNVDWASVLIKSLGETEDANVRFQVAQVMWFVDMQS